MIYRVLSEPCVYISLHYRNVQAPQGADDIGARVPDSRGALSRQRFGSVYSHNTAACGWGAVRVDHKTVPSLASVPYSDPFLVSCRFPDLRIMFP